MTSGELLNIGTVNRRLQWSYHGERLCQSNGRVVCAWRSTPRPKRPLGRESAPLGECAGSSLFVDLASDEMALLIEVVVDLGMKAAPYALPLDVFATSSGGVPYPIDAALDPFISDVMLSGHYGGAFFLSAHPFP